MSMSIDRERIQRARSPLGQDGHGIDAEKIVDTRAEEQRVRTRGSCMIISGSAVVILTLIIAIVWYMGFDSNMPTAFLLPLYGAGFSAISLGCVEYLGRPTRGTQQQIVRGLLDLIDLLPEELRQKWYAGYVEATKDSLRRTGTDSSAQSVGTAEILRLQRRNGPTRLT